MSAVAPIAPIAAGVPSSGESLHTVAGKSGMGFADMITAGLARADASVAKADALVAAFAKGETVPVHEVTLAMEQARLSVEIAVEVRSRLLEAYRDFMNMQL